MRAREERPGEKAGSTGRGVRRVASTPAGVGRGPMSPAQAASLQGLVGNRVVARLVDEERHTHGAGCGHDAVEDTSPVGQRSLLDAALASPSRSLPSSLRAEAEAFYQRDLSATRVHDNAVAQRATVAMGAQAMTVGHHIFVSPTGVRDKALMGHELSHVKSNLGGVPETGISNGAGVTVTDPGQDSERGAETDGTAFAAGEGSAPSVVAQRAALGGPTAAAGTHVVGRAVAPAPLRQGSGSCSGLAVQRMAGDTKGKGKAEGSGTRRRAAWEERAQHIGELAKQCTCRQQDSHAGRVDPEAFVRYARSYKGQPDEQSLRHLSRVLYNNLAQLPEQEQEQESTEVKGTGAQSASQGRAKKQEKEVQAMLINGHLVFATNMNQSVDRLHKWLLGSSATDSEDADGRPLHNFLLADHEGSGYEAENEQETASTAPGKRRAGKAEADPQSGKRRKTDKGAAAGTAQASSGKGEQERRDRQARLKLGKGFATQAMPPVPLDADVDMDDSEAEGQSGSYQRDNRTLQALRNIAHIRKVDISNSLAKDPAYRAYLGELLSATSEYANYAYLLHNGDVKEEIHAEQKLLMLLNNADVGSETPLDGPILIRGRKRPCKGCLALLDYVRKTLALDSEKDLKYNPRPNHYFQDAVDSGVKHFYRDAGEKSEDFYQHLGQELGTAKPHYASAPRHALPSLPGEGVHEAESDGEGGLQQRVALTEMRDEETGEVTYLRYPPNSNMQLMVDTPSTSEVSDDSESELAIETGRLTLADRAGRTDFTDLGRAKSAPAVDKRAVAEQGERKFENEIVPLLLAEMHPELQEERRTHKEGAKYKEQFPESLLSKITELTTGANPATTKARIAGWFTIKPAALQKKLASAGSEDTRKQARGIDGAVENEIKAAMDPGFREKWENVPKGKSMSRPLPEFSERFAHVLWQVMFGRDDRVSSTSVGKYLKLSPSTFANRATAMRAKWGDPRGNAGAGPSQ